MGVKTYKRHGTSIYDTPRWKSVRFLAKRRDGFKCVKCGGVNRLQVDHVKPLRTHPDLAFDLGNLQTLCVRCHSAKTQAEVGFETPASPERQAWKSLVYELSKRTPSHA
jgi:5-methylcytosine-specific restriction endonuclease McrA